MMRHLMRKELASMRPFLVLLALLTLITLFDITTRTVTEAYADLVRATGLHWKTEAGLLLVLAFALGSGMVAREQDEGTLAFLDGLPVTRGAVFLAKLATAGACIFVFSLVGPALSLAAIEVLHRSTDVPVGLAAPGWLAARYALLSLLGVALGMACGAMRQLAWLVLGLLAMLVAILHQSWPRVGAALDPTGLVAQGWSTQGFGGETVAAACAVTLLCLAVAWLLFAGAGGARMQRLGELGQSRPAQVMLYGLSIGTFVAYAVITSQERGGSDDRDEEAGAEQVAREEDAARRFRSRHYVFSAPKGFARGPELSGRADAAFADAAALLGLDPAAQEAIDVDLSGSVRHTAGVAALHRIRMRVEDDWYDTLVHETMHVLAARLAGAEHNRELDKMKLLNEGLAHWAEPGRRASAARRAADELAAAVPMRRRLLNSDLLLGDGKLARHLDWEAVYPLGAQLVEALVARYGDAAPARVLATLGKPDFPREQSGHALYRIAFQRAGYDLDLVMFDYAERLKTLAEQHAAAIDALPRPRALLLQRDGRVGIALRFDRPLAPGQRPLVRFRPRADSPVHEYTIVAHMRRSGGLPVAWLPREQVADEQVCFQGGIASGGRIDYEPWSCLPL